MLTLSSETIGDIERFGIEGWQITRVSKEIKIDNLNLVLRDFFT